MKKKKISKEKLKIKELESKLGDAIYLNNRISEEQNRLSKIVTTIENIVGADKRINGDVVSIVSDLYYYKKFHEGAVLRGYDVVENQREVIRWLINPETAENSKELESYKKQFGPGRF